MGQVYFLEKDKKTQYKSNLQFQNVILNCLEQIENLMQMEHPSRGQGKTL